MFNSGKTFRATKKINIVLSEKKILNETKNHTPPPPFQVKWSVPNALLSPNTIPTIVHSHDFVL